jgi:hypothetical protein
MCVKLNTAASSPLFVTTKTLLLGLLQQYKYSPAPSYQDKNHAPHTRYPPLPLWMSSLLVTPDKHWSVFCLSLQICFASSRTLCMWITVHHLLSLISLNKSFFLEFQVYACVSIVHSYLAPNIIRPFHDCTTKFLYWWIFVLFSVLGDTFMNNDLVVCVKEN